MVREPDAHRLLAVPAEELGGVRDLALRLGDRLAHLERHHEGELVGPCDEQLVGAAQDLAPADIDEAQIAASAIVYLEGYLWDPPHAKEAFRKAAKIAHDNKRQVALTLSDSFCVGRYRAEFVDLIRTGTVDLLFANESELLSLYETSDFNTAVRALQSDAKLAAVTRSEKGSVVIKGSETHTVPAAPVARVVDTTGAGDLYAAGFLFGFTHGKPLAECARLGGIAAAEVISHVGARPEKALKGLI